MRCKSHHQPLLCRSIRLTTAATRVPIVRLLMMSLRIHPHFATALWKYKIVRRGCSKSANHPWCIFNHGACNHEALHHDVFNHDVFNHGVYAYLGSRVLATVSNSKQLTKDYPFETTRHQSERECVGNIKSNIKEGRIPVRAGYTSEN